LKVVYGVQGPANKVGNIAFPPGSTVARLTYDRPPAEHKPDEILIHAPGVSWGVGRNLLINLLKNAHQDFDYIVLLDHDVEFAKGSFLEFEEKLRLSRPAAAFPLMPKAEGSMTLLKDLHVQRAIALDEQMVALHRSVVDTVGIGQLITAFDWASWYISSFVFEYSIALKLAGAAHQYNEIIIINQDHAWMTGTNTSYTRGNQDLYVPLAKDVIASLHGGFDPSIIEQLDDEPTSRRSTQRRALASILVTFDGQPVPEMLRGATSIEERVDRK
jgi:hypothetical protein